MLALPDLTPGKGGAQSVRTEFVPRTCVHTLPTVETRTLPWGACYTRGYGRARVTHDPSGTNPRGGQVGAEASSEPLSTAQALDMLERAILGARAAHRRGKGFILAHGETDPAALDRLLHTAVIVICTMADMYGTSNREITLMFQGARLAERDTR